MVLALAVQAYNMHAAVAEASLALAKNTYVSDAQKRRRCIVVRIVFDTPACVSGFAC